MSVAELGPEWHQYDDPWCPCVNCVRRRIDTRTWPAQDWDYNNILDEQDRQAALDNDAPVPVERGQGVIRLRR